MPRVTPEYTAARRQHILDAARACFLRDGFHQTSMQDIQREAGLSAGAIYLYFKSKDELIIGIVGQILDTLTHLLPREPADDVAVPSLASLIRRILGEAERLHREHRIFVLALQVWAEAVRNPVMLATLRTSIDSVRGQLELALERFQAQGLVRPDADRGHLALVIVGLGQGYIVQRAMLDDLTLDGYLSGIESLLASAGPTAVVGPSAAG